MSCVQRWSNMDNTVSSKVKQQNKQVDDHYTLAKRPYTALFRGQTNIVFIGRATEIVETNIGCIDRATETVEQTNVFTVKPFRATGQPAPGHGFGV